MNINYPSDLGADTSVFPSVETSSISFTSDNYSPPYLINSIVLEDKVELIFRRDPNYTYTVSANWITSNPQPLIYKQVITWEEGKTKVSVVYGKYIPAQSESYTFND